jgi:hypothetical protein
MTYTVTVVEPITTVTVTEQAVNVATTEQTVTVFASTNGAQGAVGAGVPIGGATGYILAKTSATDYATAWVAAPPAKGDPTMVLAANNSGADIPRGTIVTTSSAYGFVSIRPALADADVRSARTLGWTNELIVNGGTGYVITDGYISNVDTSAASSAGVQLYLSGTVAGGWTSTKTSAPTHMVYVGVCIVKDATVGQVFVKIQNGFELEELHNVAVSSVADNQVIVYDAATSLWKNEATPIQAVFSKQDTLAPYTGTARYYLDATRTISQIRASVGTAPTGSGLTVTVYKNGSSIGSVTIPAGSYTATSTISVAASANDYLTVSIISVGSTISGSDLTVTVTA